MVALESINNIFKKMSDDGIDTQIENAQTTRRTCNLQKGPSTSRDFIQKIIKLK